MAFASSAEAPKPTGGYGGSDIGPQYSTQESSGIGIDGAGSAGYRADAHSHRVAEGVSAKSIASYGLRSSYWPDHWTQDNLVSSVQETPGSIPSCVLTDAVAFQSGRIDHIHRIVQNIAIKISVAAGKRNWVFRGPAASAGVVITRTEVNEFGVLIVEAAREPEGLKSGIGVADHVAELVIVHALGDLAGGSVNYKPWAADVIREYAIGHSARHHVVGTVAAAAVDELAYDLIVAVELGDEVSSVI